VPFSVPITIDLKRLKGKQPTDRTNQAKAYSRDISIGEIQGKHQYFQSFTSAINAPNYLLKVRNDDFLTVGQS
jgi:hypothetical protein